MMLVAVSSPARWGDWGAGLCHAFGFDVCDCFDWGHRRVHMVAPGVPVVGGVVWEPCAVLLAPEVALVYVVPPFGRPRWAAPHRPGWSATMTWWPLDEAVLLSQAFYLMASSPRRGAMKANQYNAFAELLDEVPFVGSYYRALAERGPLSGPPPWDAW